MTEIHTCQTHKYIQFLNITITTWLKVPKIFVMSLLRNLAYQKSNKARLISDVVFYVFQFTIVIENEIFLHIGCKWNPRTKKFKRHRSKWNLLFRSFH